MDVTNHIECVAGSPDYWLLTVHNDDYDFCNFTKPINGPCPAGTYTKTSNGCGNCPSTIDVI
jgi:hypothetical protein